MITVTIPQAAKLRKFTRDDAKLFPSISSGLRWLKQDADDMARLYQFLSKITQDHTIDEAQAIAAFYFAPDQIDRTGDKLRVWGAYLHW
jgi:hypothetical protein